MRKGVCIGTVPGGPSEEGLALARELGFQGVELNALEDDAAREQAARLAREQGLEITSVMNRAHWRYPLSDPDPAVRRTSVEGVLDSFRTARAAGTDTVLLVPAVVTPQVSYQEAWIRSQAEILELARLAEEQGLVLAIENVWNRFLLSPREFVEYVDQFESPAVAAYFDVGNICLYGYPGQWIRTLGRRIRRVHLKGFDTRTRSFTPTLSGGDIDWPGVTEALQSIGYDGWLTAEMPQDKQDPRGGLQALSEEMDRLFSDVLE